MPVIKVIMEPEQNLSKFTLKLWPKGFINTTYGKHAVHEGLIWGSGSLKANSEMEKAWLWLRKEGGSAGPVHQVAVWCVHWSGNVQKKALGCSGRVKDCFILCVLWCIVSWRSCFCINVKKVVVILCRTPMLPASCENQMKLAVAWMLSVIMLHPNVILNAAPWYRNWWLWRHACP